MVSKASLREECRLHRPWEHQEGRLLSLEDLSAFQMGPSAYDQCPMSVRRAHEVLDNDEGVGRWKHIKAFYRVVCLLRALAKVRIFEASSWCMNTERDRYEMQ